MGRTRPREDTDTPGRSHVTTEAEIGVMYLQAKGCQELPANHQEPEEARKDSTLQAAEGARPCRHLDLRLPAPRTVREPASVT